MNKEYYEERILKADEHYWRTGENFLPESEYNEYCRKLTEIDPENEILNNIHTPELNTIEKIKHKKPMLSLQKCYSVEELKKWMNKISRNDDELFIVMPKYDGIAGRYENGNLSSRGNGLIGESLTHHKNVIKNLRKTNYDGELIITNKDFQKYFGENGIYAGRYKNSRNGISGLMGSKETPFTEKLVTFVSYDDISETCTIDTLDVTLSTIRIQMEDYPTDGVVVKLADGKYAESLGYTSHHYKHSIALKHNNVSKKTTLRDVEFTIARETIGIVGILDPIELGGVTIKRVSLHNMDIVNKLDLHIGDTVIVERAGDVIPYVVDAIAGKNRKAIFIDKCPVCSSEVILDKQFFKCINEYCEGKVVNRIISCSNILGLKNIASATIKKLYDGNFIEDIVDFLKTSEITFRKLDGFAEKSAKNAFEEIQKVNIDVVYDYQILACLNIEGIGTRIAKKILEKFTIEELMSMDLEDLAQHDIPDFGNIRLQKLDYGKKQHSDLLNKLLDHFPNYINTKDIIKEKIKNSVCFTGKMPEARNFYEKLAIDSGFEVSSGVNKNLNYLVVADVNSTSSKTTKAKKLNINIISVNDFMELIQ